MSCNFNNFFFMSVIEDNKVRMVLIFSTDKELNEDIKGSGTKDEEILACVL